jgi:hypothetical protein
MAYTHAVCGRCGCQYQLSQEKRSGGGRGDDPLCPCEGAVLYTEKQGYTSSVLERTRPNPDCDHGREKGFLPL